MRSWSWWTSASCQRVGTRTVSGRVCSGRWGTPGPENRAAEPQPVPAPAAVRVEADSATFICHLTGRQQRPLSLLTICSLLSGGQSATAGGREPWRSSSSGGGGLPRRCAAREDPERPGWHRSVSAPYTQRSSEPALAGRILTCCAINAVLDNSLSSSLWPLRHPLQASKHSFGCLATLLSHRSHYFQDECTRTYVEYVSKRLVWMCEWLTCHVLFFMFMLDVYQVCFCRYLWIKWLNFSFLSISTEPLSTLQTI